MTTPPDISYTMRANRNISMLPIGSTIEGLIAVDGEITVTFNSPRLHGDYMLMEKTRWRWYKGMLESFAVKDEWQGRVDRRKLKRMMRKAFDKASKP